MYRNQFFDGLWWLLLGGWWLLACTAPEDKQPDNLIPQSRMATILTQIHLAEARVTRLSLGSTDSSNLVYRRLEQGVFRQFQVDTSAYTKSYIFYSSHPRKMEAIYKEVAANLKKEIDSKQKSLRTKKPAQPAPIPPRTGQPQPHFRAKMPAHP